VGHGNWLTWLDANWPELGDRTAQYYMKIDSDNPNANAFGFEIRFDPQESHRKGAEERSVRKSQAINRSVSQSTTAQW
jgi:hypothetical protein